MSFQFESPGRIAFSLFGLDIYYYGLLMGLGICIVLLYANKIAKNYYGLNNIIPDIAPVVLVCGILGARLYYCTLNINYYLRFPIEILAIRQGGLSIHGALLGGFIAILIECRRNGIKPAEICDIFAYVLPLGQAIVRWGNFFNSEAFGYPSTLPWKLYISPESRPIEYINADYFHPAFLYESIFDIVVFGVMLYCLKHHNKLKNGQITCIYLIFYSLGRIFIEFIRIDCSGYIFGLPFPVFISGIIIVICSLYLIKKRD